MKKVVITGASRGIGEALAAQYVASGAEVLAIARHFNDQPPIPGVRQLSADIGTQQGREAIRDYLHAHQWQIDVLVNNAGVQHVIEMASADTESVVHLAEEEVNVNLLSPIILCHLLLPLMQKQGGVIVNVTSLLALHPKPSAPVYAATKAGLQLFTRALRLQLSTSRIHVAEVIPSLVETRMTRHQKREKLSPEDMAAIIIKGIDQRKAVIGPATTHLIMQLNRLAPNWLARQFAK